MKEDIIDMFNIPCLCPKSDLEMPNQESLEDYLFDIGYDMFYPVHFAIKKFLLQKEHKVLFYSAPSGYGKTSSLFTTLIPSFKGGISSAQLVYINSSQTCFDTCNGFPGYSVGTNAKAKNDIIFLSPSELIKSLGIIENARIIVFDDFENAQVYFENIWDRIVEKAHTEAKIIVFSGDDKMVSQFYQKTPCKKLLFCRSHQIRNRDNENYCDQYIYDRQHLCSLFSLGIKHFKAVQYYVFKYLHGQIVTNDYLIPQACFFVSPEHSGKTYSIIVSVILHINHNVSIPQIAIVVSSTNEAYKLNELIQNSFLASSSVIDKKEYPQSQVYIIPVEFLSFYMVTNESILVLDCVESSNQLSVLDGINYKRFGFCVILETKDDLCLYENLSKHFNNPLVLNFYE